MSDFNYSDEAYNILNKFRGVDKIVYVEGQDDIPFWELIFKKLSMVSVEVLDLGGIGELKKLIGKIESGEIESIVACDTDYSYFEVFSSHPNVLRSYGYSVENTLIDENTIRKVVHSMGKVSSSAIDNHKISESLNNFYTAIEEMTRYEIANFITDSGVRIAGKNCARFLKNGAAPVLCDNKIRSYLESCSLSLDEAIRIDINAKIESINRAPKDFVSGHFLFSFVLRFVSYTIKSLRGKITLSAEALFGSMILAFETLFNSRHPHYGYYDNIIKNIQI